MGTCDAETGHCDCKPGFYGTDGNCDSCSSGCTGDKCEAESGTCDCKTWWDGDRCDIEVSKSISQLCAFSHRKNLHSSGIIFNITGSCNFLFNLQLLAHCPTMHSVCSR